MRINEVGSKKALSLVLVGGCLVGAACSSAGSAVTPTPGASVDAGIEGTGAPSQADAGSDDGSADAAPAPPQTYLRVVHASPDAPAVDLCVAPHGTGVFQGPLLGQLAAASGGATEDGGGAGAGIAFGQVSAYLSLNPGQYDVRLVPAGAASCDLTPLAARPFDADASADAGGEDGGLIDASGPPDGAVDAGGSDGASDASIGADASAADDAEASAPVEPSDWTGLPSLGANERATLLLAGDSLPAGSDAPLGATVLPDDAVLAGGAVVLRAINAVPSAPSLDFGLGADGGWLPLLTSVAFAHASAQAAPSDGTVDPNGYLSIAPVTTDSLVARPPATAFTAVGSGAQIPLGSIATVIAIGGKTGDAANLPALLLCMDNQPSGGLLSDCSVVP